MIESHLENLKGFFSLVHRDKDGKLLGQYPIIPNGITNEGKNAILNIMFYSTSKISNWYIGLISNSGYTGVAAADTAASHSGWTEFTDYSGDRKGWTTSATSTQSITSASSSSFSITAGGTLKGLFVQSTATKSSTAGTLWSTALFSADLAVNNGDTLSIVYTVTA